MGTCNDATVDNMLGSNVPPDTSLTMSAPASMAALATMEWLVSMDMGTSNTDVDRGGGWNQGNM